MPIISNLCDNYTAGIGDPGKLVPFLRISRNQVILVIVLSYTADGISD